MPRRHKHALSEQWVIADRRRAATHRSHRLLCWSQRQASPRKRHCYQRILLECAVEQARYPLRRTVVSEETLTTPVIVADAAPGLAARAAVAGPAYVVLAGISFSHFLNDTMQSLIASVYPI